ncbi:hypothetical protein Hanom_Chr17g01554991 [Helianthus anomalus]
MNLKLPLSSNSFSKRQSRALKRPLGRGFKRPVIKHNRPTDTIISRSCCHLLVEPLTDY